MKDPSGRFEFNGRGYFWWSDEQTPQGHFAPDTGAYGSLTINSVGQIDLELDNQLPNSRGLLDAFSDRVEINRSIAGILKETDEHVFLTKLGRGNTSIHSNGLSHEAYRALIALRSKSALPDIGPGAAIFSGFQTSLSGFEAWFNLKSIEVDKAQSSTQITYKTPKRQDYKLPDGIMTLEHSLRGIPLMRQVRELHVVEDAQFVFTASQPLTLKALIDEHWHLEDFLVVLTNCERNLEWPIAQFNQNGPRATIYFGRARRTDEPPSWADYWMSFSQLAENFETILAEWRTKRETFGPGFYMYLGTRRGMHLYVEHRFMNLMFGLESFHRTLHPKADNGDVRQKVDRILTRVDSTTDRKWLARQLAHCTEPALEERLIELFQTLPLDIPPEKLQAFTRKCARYRNDIAHFGGPRNAEERKHLVPSLDVLNEALDLLYHLMILREIGVSDRILRHIITEGFYSFILRHRLQSAGLAQKAALLPLTH